MAGPLGAGGVPNGLMCPVRPTGIMSMGVMKTQPTTYVITGTARNQAGAAVANATISAFETVTKKQVAEAKSDAQGAYRVVVSGAAGLTFFVTAKDSGGTLFGITVDTLTAVNA